MITHTVALQQRTQSAQEITICSCCRCWCQCNFKYQLIVKLSGAFDLGQVAGTAWVECCF